MIIIIISIIICIYIYIYICIYVLDVSLLHSAPPPFSLSLHACYCISYYIMI